MASEDGTQLTRVTGTTVLAPLGVHDGGRDFSFPFAVEARNWSKRRQLQSFVKVYQARCQLLRLLVEEQRLAIDLERVLFQLENVGSIREIEKRRMHATLKQQSIDAELQTLRHRVERARLEAETEEIKRRSEEIKLSSKAGLTELRVAVEKKELENRLAQLTREEEVRANPPAAPKAKTPAEQIHAALEAGRDIAAAIRTERDALVRSVGGEDNLTEEMREELDQLELLGRVYTQQVRENLAYGVP